MLYYLTKSFGKVNNLTALCARGRRKLPPLCVESLLRKSITQGIRKPFPLHSCSDITESGRALIIFICVHELSEFYQMHSRLLFEQNQDMQRFPFGAERNAFVYDKEISYLFDFRQRQGNKRNKPCR